LTADALWLQETWQLRQVPLRTLAAVETPRNRKTLALTQHPEAGGATLRLTFADAAQRQRWAARLEARLPQLLPEPPPDDRPVPEGVALVAHAPDVPHVVLGRVTFTGESRRTADRGLQLRAGIRGADAVIGVERHRCPDLGWAARTVSGVAIRVEDTEARRRLRLRWYGEEVGALVNRLLLLLLFQMAILFVVGVFCVGLSRFHAPTGEALPEALRSAGLGLGLGFGWPLVLFVLLRVLRWPQLLPAAGIAVLTATTGRMLGVWLGHGLALHSTGAGLEGLNGWMFLDPLDWTFAIAGVVLCARARRLGRDAPHILPPELQSGGTVRKTGARAALILTAVYGLALAGVAGTARYQASAHLLLPGVDPRREQQALLALNQGAEQANRGELGSAEGSLQRALRLWEELAPGPSAPPSYRANLAMTLRDLGWICLRQGRDKEAETYYARAAALADELKENPALDEVSRQDLARARRVLAELHGEQTLKVLEEKDQSADRKFEEAQVKAANGAPEAEGLYREAIALWEEVLRQAKNEAYRKASVGRLAAAYGQLGELLVHLGKRPEAVAVLKKAIDYGEEAETRDPGRPLTKHNLDVSRRLLERQHEEDLQEEIDRLWTAERFADAGEVFVRGIAEQEALLRSDKDREAATRRLAYRLDRYAWFLAHCPDDRVRDTPAAVRTARRATDLQADLAEYWYTLALVQYRNGDWRGSLVSLEKVKAREGEYAAGDWLLIAMNRHRLRQRDEAWAALRKAVEWMDERKRQAEDNPVLRIQYELMRRPLEQLRREAEKLLEGKDPANQGVG
jgi:tetratricopeptide (TPR) repeat protein